MKETTIPCVECGAVHGLDCMVRHGEKGKYHCIDCETDYNSRQYNPIFSDIKKNQGRLRKIFAWILGLMIVLTTVIGSMGALTDDLLVSYTFDTNSSDDYTAIMKNDGVLTNNPTKEGSCKIGGCYSFNTVDDEEINSEIAITIDGTDARAVSLWLNPTGCKQYGIIFGWGDQSASGKSFNLACQFTDNHYWFNGYDGFDYDTGVSSSDDYGTWVHLVYEYEGGNVKIYRNTVNILNQSSAINTQNTVLNVMHGTGMSSINGSIDEILVYNRSLTGEEIDQLYNSGNGYQVPEAPFGLDYFPETPVNNTNINTDTKVYYNLSTTVNTTCRFYLNDTLKLTKVQQTTSRYYFDFNSSIFTQGLNKVNITCNKSGTFAYDTEKFLFVDTTDPVIHQAKWVEGSQRININQSVIDGNIVLEINVSDANLYSFNISICHNTTDGSIDFASCEYIDKSVDIQDTYYVYNQTANLGLFSDDGNHSFYIEVCDAHTGLDIGDMYTGVFDGSRIDIGGFSIEPVTSSVYDITTTKYSDRVSFTSKSSKAESLLIYDISSPEPVYYRSRSGYKAHFVSGNYWLDFENGYYDVQSVQKLSDYSYRVNLYSGVTMGEIEFKSVGVINCINQTLRAFIEQEGDNVTIHSPKRSWELNDSAVNITFNYTPFYGVGLSPENCTLIVNGTELDIDYTITEGAVNTFTYEFFTPPAQQRQYYNVTIRCHDAHNHPPYGTQDHVETSDLLNWSIFNLAVTTTVTTTTQLQFTQDGSVQEFQSTTQGMFYIFLLALWCLMLYWTLTLKGDNGRPVLIINLFQLVLGLVAGVQFMWFSYLIGFSVIAVSMVVFIGKAMYS